MENAQGGVVIESVEALAKHRCEIVEMYYIQDGVKQFTTTEITTFNASTLSEVRKYNKALSAEQKSIIGH